MDIITLCNGNSGIYIYFGLDEELWNNKVNIKL